MYICRAMKSIRKLIGTDIIDKEKKRIGKIDDALIGKQDLVIRYMLIPHPEQNINQTVIPISPALVQNQPRINSSKPFILRFSKNFILQGPDTEASSEEEIYQYYNCTPYWTGPELWGRGEFPQQLFLEEYSSHAGDSNTNWVKRFIRAKEKSRGVKDYIFDERAWKIQYFVSKTGKLLAPGKAFNYTNNR